MTETVPCYACLDGVCWWVSCDNDADFVLDVALKRHGKPLYSGKIELCHGHTRVAQERNGRLDLNWEAVEQAISMSKIRS